MRIVDTNSTASSSPAQSGRTGAARPEDSNGSNPSGSGQISQSGDSVHLSGFSGKVAQTLQSDAAARTQKVNEIAGAVQSRTYKVNAKTVSHALVKQALGETGSDADGS